MTPKGQTLLKANSAVEPRPTGDVSLTRPLHAKQLVVTKPRTLEIKQLPTRPPSEGEVCVVARHLGISVGTELNTYRGGVNWHTGRDEKTGLFNQSADSQDWQYPASLGYAHVGQIVEVGEGVDDLHIGQWVYSTTGHATCACMPASRFTAIPKDQDPRKFVFLQLVRTALGIVHHANPTLGDTAAVYGLGAVGLIVVQLLKRAGVSNIIAFDLLPARREMAKRFGANCVLDPSETDDPAMQVRQNNGGQPTDIAIETASNVKALHAAIRSVCQRGRVVIGSMPAKPWTLHFGQEMHFNGVRLYGANVTAEPDDLGPGWNSERRLAYAKELALQLDLIPLITNTYSFDQSPNVYQMLDEGAGDFISVLLECAV